jgi:DNA repair protein RadD
MSDVSTSAPGFSISALLAQAPEPALRDLVGPSVIDVLTLLDPALISGTALCDLATRLIDPAPAMRDPAIRGKLIDLLPLPKARELAAKFHIRVDASLYARLRNVAANPALELSLFSFFGIVEDPRAPLADRPSKQSIAAGYGLFDHQRTAALRVKKFLAESPRKVILHMPTGAGKTRTAMHIVADYLRAAGPALVCWLAQSAELLEQAASEFEQAWRHLGDRPVDLLRMWGDDAPSLEGVRDGLLVAGLAKLNALDSRDPNTMLRLADRAALTVIDEAHQAIAPTYRSLITTLHEKRPRNALLGLTATPGRTWSDIAEDAELAAFFDNTKVTLEVEGYSDPITFLIEEGYLARPMFKTLNSKAGIKLSDRDVAEMATALDIPTSVLGCLAGDHQRNLRIITTLEEMLHRHRRIIVFGATVAHARLLAAILIARGHNADVVTSETDTSSRERAIRRFKSANPSPMILCNYGVLTTGFDAPATSAALIARPTRSLVLYSQMVGRATRGPRAGGNRTAEIVTVTDPDLPGFGSVAEAFSNWEDVWHERR